MTTFHSRQSDCEQRVRQKADANALQIHVMNRNSKLRSQVDKAQTIVCNNFQRTVQAHVTELSFYTSHAVPLDFTRFLRLAPVSPLDQRSPARWPYDGRETTGETSGEISHLKSEPRPGDGRALAMAMPPNIRQDDSQDNLGYAGNGGAMSTPETCWTTGEMVAQQPGAIRATVEATSRRMTHLNLTISSNYDIQEL